MKTIAANLTFVVLAYNEEAYLRTTVTHVLEAISSVQATGVELIIVNDGSDDETKAIADQLEREIPFVRAIHHPENRGFGAAFRTGLHAAKREWISFLPGDDLISVFTMREILLNTGKADLVCAFPLNIELRSRPRQVLSSLFSYIYRQTFNLGLRAIHTTPVFNTRQLRDLKLRSERYSVGSEIMVRLMRQGCSYMEFGGYLNPSRNKSSALRIKNLVEVVRNYLLLVFEVFVTDRSRYSKTAVRLIPETPHLEPSVEREHKLLPIDTSVGIQL